MMPVSSVQDASGNKSGDRMSRFGYRAALSLLVVALSAVSVAAATNQIKVAIDTDNNSSTGCSVVTAAGTFSGAEQILITTYDPDAKTVTSVIRQRCVGATFGGAEVIDAGGWSVGSNGGVSLIETHMPW